MLAVEEMNQNTAITKALTHIFSGVEQLRAMFPEKKFTVDGRLVGDIGEAIAALEYDIQLYKRQQADHDGETSNDRKIQVKATFKNSLTFTAVPDFYLGFKLFNDGRHEEIFNGPGRMIYERYKHRKGIGKTQLSFPIKELKNLSENVPNSDRIPLRKDR
jgi:hypothetical protein